jgi:hypothetical protein
MAPPVYRRLLGSMLLVGLVGCAGTVGTTPGYPLYKTEPARLPDNQIARLGTKLPLGGGPGVGATSFIKAVDGRNVSNIDSIFDLLPGCHVIQTESRFVMGNDNVTWQAELGSRVFALEMKPAHVYFIVVELIEGMGGSGRIKVFATEEDATGKQTGTFPPPATLSDAMKCRPSQPLRTGP